MFFSPVVGSTAKGRGTKFREPTGQRITTGDYAGALELDTSSSRHGADWTAPAGDFVLCTTSLRGWTAADTKHLHHTIFIKTANSVCRGAGNSPLPRSMRARSPHVLFPRRRFQRGTKFREPTGQRITAGDSAGALELDTSSSRH